jgi:hypothetical protein
MNLITETKTYLSSSKWHSSIVVIKKSSEVNEDTLSSLGAEETTLSSSGSNLCLEHQVERKGL